MLGDIITPARLKRKKPIIHSKLEQLGPVNFPPFLGERFHMVKLVAGRETPEELIRWMPTISSMLSQIEGWKTLYVMVDETYVRKGKLQRRGGVHMDGSWNEDGDHGMLAEKQTILIASTHEGCAGYIGKVAGSPAIDGDCSHLDLSKMDRVMMAPNTCYAMSESTLHESVAVARACQRQLIRINIANYPYPF